MSTIHPYSYGRFGNIPNPPEPADPYDTMRPIDIYNNLRSWDYDIGGYKLNRAEAETIIQIIDEYLQSKQVGDDGK